MSEYANLQYLEQYLPNNWWSLSLKSTTDRRIRTTKESASIPPDPALCDLCRSLDWEYLLFGSPNTGFKRAYAETVCLGQRSDITKRASGCSFCSGIVAALLEEIDAWYQDPKTSSGCVHLDVSESETQELAALGHKSYCIMVSLRSPGACKVASIGTIATDEERPATSKIYGSRAAAVLLNHDLSVYQTIPPRADLPRCKTWLDACCEKHQSCGEAASAPAGRSRDTPIKLIDVGSRYVVSFASKAKLEYATLSYVCGPGYSLCVLQGSDQWTKDSSGNPQHPLPEVIPATISDTMLLVKALDIRHLWVDSICIAQDDEEEKATQIRAMFSIYDDAKICIVSASGLDSHTPLPGVSISRAPLLCRQVTLKANMTLGLPYPALGTQLERYRYMKRAWPYQEVLLSKRTLFFTSDEIFFFCAQSTHQESRLEREGEDVEAGTWASLAPESKSHIIGNAVSMRQTADPAQLCRLFAAAAQEYSQRELSYQEDVVNAFFGLCSLFDQLLKTESFLGCPKSMLLNALTWKDPRVNIAASQLPKRRMLTKQSDVAALPTWAWASYDGPVKLTAIPYTFAQSACRLYDSQKPLAALQELVSATRTSERDVLCTCNFPEHRIEIAYGRHFFISTKAITLTVSAEGDEKLMPGQADLATLADRHLGPCDFRGQATLDQLHLSEVTLMQLYAGQNSGKPGSVCALVLRTCRLIDSVLTLREKASGDNNSGNVENQLTAAQAVRSFAEDALRPANLMPQLAIDPPEPAEHKTFKQSLWTKGCPQEVIVKEGDVSKPEDVLVGTRLGISYVNMKEWVALEPKSSLIVLR